MEIMEITREEIITKLENAITHNEEALVEVKKQWYLDGISVFTNDCLIEKNSIEKTIATLQNILETFNESTNDFNINELRDLADYWLKRSVTDRMMVTYGQSVSHITQTMMQDSLNLKLASILYFMASDEVKNAMKVLQIRL